MYLAILSADLKHGIDFRHPMSSSLGLRSDLIPTASAPIRLPTRSRPEPVTPTAVNRISPNRWRIMPQEGLCGQLLPGRLRCADIESLPVRRQHHQNEIGTGKNRCRCQCAATFWNDLGSVWLRKARAGAQFQFGQCLTMCVLLMYGPENHSVDVTAKIHLLNPTFCMVGTDRTSKSMKKIVCRIFLFDRPLLFNLLVYDYRQYSSNISPDRHSESNPHSPVGHCR